MKTSKVFTAAVRGLSGSGYAIPDKFRSNKRRAKVQEQVRMSERAGTGEN
jgi:hypothetical protein